MNLLSESKCNCLHVLVHHLIVSPETLLLHLVKFLFSFPTSIVLFKFCCGLFFLCLFFHHFCFVLFSCILSACAGFFFFLVFSYLAVHLTSPGHHRKRSSCLTAIKLKQQNLKKTKSPK